MCAASGGDPECGAGSEYSAGGGECGAGSERGAAAVASVVTMLIMIASIKTKHQQHEKQNQGLLHLFLSPKTLQLRTHTHELGQVDNRSSTFNHFTGTSEEAGQPCSPA